MISTPVAQFNYGTTIAAGGLVAVTNAVTNAISQGDLIYVTITLNSTEKSGQDVTRSTISDSQGNKYNAITTCTEGSTDGVNPPPVLYMGTATFVSMNSVPLGLADTITVAPGNLDPAFTGDVVIQCQSVTGPIGMDKGFIYAGLNNLTNDALHHPPKAPSNYSISTPTLNTASQCAFGTIATFSTLVSVDPPGWTKLQTKAQGSITHTTYYQIVTSQNPVTFNPILTNSTGYTNNIIDTVYDGALPIISNLQTQGQQFPIAAKKLIFTVSTSTNIGDLIVIEAALKGTGLVAPTVTDTQSNVYTLGTSVSGNGMAMYSFYCLNAKQLFPARVAILTDKITVDCTSSAGVTDATMAMMGISSCGLWTHGFVGTGSSAISATPTFSTGVLPQNYSVAFGYVSALTSAITDPAPSEGWGLCPNSDIDAANIWVNMYAQVVPTNASLTLAPTLGSSVANLLNVETFYITGDPASPPKSSAQALVYADFQNGTYKLSGATVPLSSLFAQSGSFTGAVALDNNGMIAKVGTTKGSAPVATAGVLAAINAEISTGLTVLVEWFTDQERVGGEDINVFEIDSATGGVNLNQKTADGASPNPVTFPYSDAQLLAFLGAGGVAQAGANPPGTYNVMNPGQRNMAALNFSPATVNLSVDGGAVQSDATVSQVWPAVDMTFGVFNNALIAKPLGVHISFFAAYPLAAISTVNLPLYSLPCTRPPLGGISQGHVF